MELTLKRYFWLIPAFVIVVCGLLAAQGINNVVEAKYLLGETKKVAAARRVRPAKPRALPKAPPVKDAQAVITRNMFCSTCEPERPGSSSPAAAAPVDDNNPPATSLPLQLLATSVTSKARWSAATIYNTQTLKSGSYAVKDVIPDAGEIVRIYPRYVDFRNKASGRMERIELLGTSGTRPPPASAPPPPPTRPTPAGPDGDLLAAIDKGVRKISDSQFEIDRSLVERVLNDPTAVARSARIVPSIKDGKANGFKMYAIRPNSMYAKLGMQNGDTIQAINGFEMTSPDKALEVYTKVKSANNLSINILRRGKPMTMEYQIR